MRQYGYRRRGVAALALLLFAFFWGVAPASADAPDDTPPAAQGQGQGLTTAPGQVKKIDEAPAPSCPEGEYPNNDGGCSPPVCPDGSAVPESGECAPGCADGSEICETRSCPVDVPLPAGALCEQDGGTPASSPTPNPIVTTVSATEGGGGTAVGPAVQASVFGRPAEVLGAQFTAPALTDPTLPAVAATGADSTLLAVLGAALIGLGGALVRLSERAARAI